jgi:predicted ATP-dependent protease
MVNNRGESTVTVRAISMEQRQDAPGMEERPADGRVSVERLYRAADLSALAFETTEELEPVDGVIGQDRAVDAIRLGAGIGKPGFNIFEIGRTAARMRQSVLALLREKAPERPTPSDWVYVNNFSDGRRPVAIELPPGRAIEFRDAMNALIDDLKATLPTVFESEEYQTQRAAAEEAGRKKQEDAFTALQAKAAEQGIAILRTPMGFTLLPIRDGQVVPPEEFAAWPDARRVEVQAKVEKLEKEIEHFARQISQWERGRREAVRELNRKTADNAVAHFIDEKKTEFSPVERLVQHLDRVRADLVENVAIFIAGTPESEAEATDGALPGGPFDRYGVNVLVSHEEGEGAPVIEELHPTLSNLTGSIEHLSRQGVLLTNFRLIKAGAVHRANGGYLLLDVRNLLLEPFSWSALKRALRRR